MLTNFNT